jgi:RNA binding exosome subunit
MDRISIIMKDKLETSPDMEKYTEVIIKISREEIQELSHMNKEEADDYIQFHYGIDKSRILGGTISDEMTLSPVLTINLKK